MQLWGFSLPTGHTSSQTQKTTWRAFYTPISSVHLQSIITVVARSRSNTTWFLGTTRPDLQCRRVALLQGTVTLTSPGWTMASMLSATCGRTSAPATSSGITSTPQREWALEHTAHPLSRSCRISLMQIGTLLIQYRLNHWKCQPRISSVPVQHCLLLLFFLTHSQ